MAMVTHPYISSSWKARTWHYCECKARVGYRVRPCLRKKGRKKYREEGKEGRKGGREGTSELKAS